MKNALTILLLVLMTLALQAQSKPDKEGLSPARLKTNQMNLIAGVDIQPQSPICCFFKNTLHYPEECGDIFEEGEVVVEFVIENDGDLRDIEITNSASRKLDHAVMSCLKRTDGKWTPAMIDGMPIETHRKLHVIFDVEGNSTLAQKYEKLFEKGIKYIQRAELMEKDYFVAEEKRHEKANKLYEKALDHFEYALRYKAEQAPAYFWQSYTYEKLGDLSKMKDKMDEFEHFLSTHNEIKKEYVTIAY